MFKINRSDIDLFLYSHHAIEAFVTVMYHFVPMKNKLGLCV